MRRLHLKALLRGLSPPVAVALFDEVAGLALEGVRAGRVQSQLQVEAGLRLADLTAPAIVQTAEEEEADRFRARPPLVDELFHLGIAGLLPENGGLPLLPLLLRVRELGVRG